ncbi:hypothetical protein CAPTEDRAFT_138269 [Capitella teleta]|uniref:Phosphatidylinositol-glycan biosynthesis class W protein n=1 Tax=Capitella teleta TaxID=283909 RepID=R7UXF9_CAPTE|nr:hypothetical protein CAPTEDRAFT_138269 [Capitella teleta]|eukprot:ELU08066.1 hypothetical protein CAPTEDRAFT_138269 [Capitella teleta]
MAADYKSLHEAFVSNHEGTSLVEIACVVSTAPLGVLLRSCLIGVFCSFRFSIDFCTLILPVFLCFTVLADHAFAVCVSMALLSASLLATLTQSKHSAPTTHDYLCTSSSGKNSFISHFRAYVNVAAAISILAVDFSIFPRRFCKAETFGTGLMDIGVGAFVVANGMVAPEARGKWPSSSTLYQKSHLVLQSVISTLPLWLLGFARLLVTKSVDYHEHVSEYGVHWNFFFTLAIVKIFSTIILCIVSPKLSWLLALLLGTGYQYMLTKQGLQDVILHGMNGTDSRHGIFDANREGIFSSFGYLAIYFASVQLGKFFLFKRTKLKQWIVVLCVLIAADVCFWILLHFTQIHVDPVSRRIANLPYVIWMMAYNLQLLPCFLLVDLLISALIHRGVLPYSNSDEHCLLEAMNRNGLFYFLLVNLLTGLINMSMSTLFATSLQAVMVMLAYLVLLSVVTVTLHSKRIYLKVW